MQCRRRRVHDVVARVVIADVRFVSLFAAIVRSQPACSRVNRRGAIPRSASAGWGAMVGALCSPNHQRKFDFPYQFACIGAFARNKALCLTYK